MSYIDPQRKFLINESDLRYLIRCRCQLEALEAEGVDNWTWYSEAFKNYIEDYFSDADPEFFEDNDLSIEDIVEEQIDKYEEV